jgi:predicted nucleotidyltransferase
LGKEMISTDTKTHLADWASKNSRIVRLWAFGSRVKGTNKPDSDLDVAVEIRKEPGTDYIGHFLDHQYPWTAELSASTGLRVHLISWRLGDQAVSEDPNDSILLYEAA